MRPLIVSLFLGPVGYAVAGYKRRAIASAGLGALAILLVAYIPYLQVFAEVNWGGGSARELVDTTLVATRLWLAGAAGWLPAVAGTWAVVNLVCAIDLAWVAPKRQAS